MSRRFRETTALRTTKLRPPGTGPAQGDAAWHHAQKSKPAQLKWPPKAIPHVFWLRAVQVGRSQKAKAPEILVALVCGSNRVRLVPECLGKHHWRQPAVTVLARGLREFLCFRPV